MEREIKFRGKTSKSKWLYGDLIHNRGDVFIAPAGIANPLAKAEDFMVDENTIGQFTGLKDKNGKEIYEGDILGGCNGSINGCEWKVEPFEVKFFKNKFNVPSDWGTYGETDSTHYLEVIGNIYENPELLTK